jgi:hypothetical protein
LIINGGKRYRVSAYLRAWFVIEFEGFVSLLVVFCSVTLLALALPVEIGLEMILLVLVDEVELSVLIEDVEVDGDELDSTCNGGGGARSIFAFFLFRLTTIKLSPLSLSIGVVLIGACEGS